MKVSERTVRNEPIFERISCCMRYAGAPVACGPMAPRQFSQTFLGLANALYPSDFLMASVILLSSSMDMQSSSWNDELIFVLSMAACKTPFCMCVTLWVPPLSSYSFERLFLSASSSGIGRGSAVVLCPLRESVYLCSAAILETTRFTKWDIE